MSMNKTCPISNFTSEEDSDGINGLWFSKSNLSHQCGEAGIASQAFRFRIETKPRQRVGAFLVRFLQPFERFVLVAEAGVNVHTRDSRNETALLQFIQALEDFQRVSPPVGNRIDISGKTEAKRIVRAETQTGLHFLD